MNENESITIPKPEYSFNQQVNYNHQLHIITARLYDLDKQRWSYSLTGSESLVTSRDIEPWWMDKFNAKYI